MPNKEKDNFNGITKGKEPLDMDKPIGRLWDRLFVLSETDHDGARQLFKKLPKFVQDNFIEVTIGNLQSVTDATATDQGVPRGQMKQFFKRLLKVMIDA